MTAVGGSLQTVSVGGRTFPVAADADVSRKLGGRENEIMPNGDGTVRIKKTRVAPMLEAIVVEIDDDRGDQEYLQEISDGNDFVAVALTYASGGVYGGDGIVTGELIASSENATASLNLGGVGTWSKLA